MVKVILKSNYINGGGGSHGKNLVSYIGTRDGVEKHVQKYVDYISNREGVEKFSNHGLFTSGNNKIVLSDVQAEVGNHKGNIWLPIISLTREDAIKTGFDNGTAWKNMLSKIAPKIAEYYKIKIDNLCWHASFHNEGHHPHVHMMVYSKNPNEGYLTKIGIEKFKSMVMKEVFSLEMEQVYAHQTIQRDEMKQKCKDIFSELKTNKFEVNSELQDLVFQLKFTLQNHKGKKSYGYLKKSDKEIVDKITNKLAENPVIQNAYDLWYETRFEILAGYTDEKQEKLLLSEQQEFKSIKNMIISEVDSMDMDLSQVQVSNEAGEYIANPTTPTAPTITNAVIKVLNSAEKLFTDEIMRDTTTINSRIDKKALSKIIQKKAAQGIKHTGEDMQNTFEMSM